MARKVKAKKRSASSRKVTKMYHHHIYNWKAIAMVALVVATGLLMILVSYMGSVQDIAVQGKIMP
jgi:uncharacterized membrane-anchored protein